MAEGGVLMTREQYAELLAEASFREAALMERGLLIWGEKHVPHWREHGRDEQWIRQRIKLAQSTRSLHRAMRQRGWSIMEIFEELRKMYIESTELYDAALADEEKSPGPLRYRGNTGDLRLRYTLRVLLYETDKLVYNELCRLYEQTDNPEAVFAEKPNTRVIRDLSCVEDLELMLSLSSYTLRLYLALEQLPDDDLMPLIHAEGERLRAHFIEQHGYAPEDSAVPYIPVTLDGPQDYEEYRARECPRSS